MMNESDPTGRNQSTPGAKLDAGKAPIMRGVMQYFPLALCAVAEVSMHGAKKYSWDGWKTVPDGVNRYGDALARHLAYEGVSAHDPDSGLLHAAHAAWNALGRLELMLNEQQNTQTKDKTMNPNDTVRIKPTEHGWTKIIEYVDETNERLKKYPRLMHRMQVPKADDDGYIRGQFWSLMQFFDWSNGPGGDTNFSDMII